MRRAIDSMAAVVLQEIHQALCARELRRSSCPRVEADGTSRDHGQANADCGMAMQPRGAEY